MMYLGCGGSVQPVENFFVRKMHLGVHISTYAIAGSSIDCQFGSALLKSTSLNCNLLCREASELKARPLTFGIKLPPKANFLHLELAIDCTVLGPL
jgi:hypothetical protein